MANTISNNNIRVSKDTNYGPDGPDNNSVNFRRKKNSAKKQKVTPPQTDRLVDYWNRKKIRVHQVTSKTYQESSRLFRLLKNGKFHEKREFDEQWLKRQPEARELIKKNWEHADLKDAIDKLSAMFYEGNWPEDKSRLPKDLSTLIYNPHSKKSLLLCTYLQNNQSLEKAHPTKAPEPISFKALDTALLQVRNLASIDDDFKAMRNMLSNAEYRQLVEGVNSIVEWGQKYTNKFKGDQMMAIELEPVQVVKYYLRYLDEATSKEIEPFMIGTKTKWFAGFPRYMTEVLIGEWESYSKAFTDCG
jgi:hypothetical protein